MVLQQILLTREMVLLSASPALAVLSGMRHTIVAADHGQEALLILESQHFDVILSAFYKPVWTTTFQSRCSERHCGRRSTESSTSSLYRRQIVHHANPHRCLWTGAPRLANSKETALS